MLPFIKKMKTLKVLLIFFFTEKTSFILFLSVNIVTTVIFHIFKIKIISVGHTVLRSFELLSAILRKQDFWMKDLNYPLFRLKWRFGMWKIINQSKNEWLFLGDSPGFWFEPAINEIVTWRFFESVDHETKNYVSDGPIFLSPNCT